MEGHKGEWSTAGPWFCDDDCPNPECIVQRALEAENPVTTETDYGYGGECYEHAVGDWKMAAAVAVGALKDAGLLKENSDAR